MNERLLIWFGIVLPLAIVNAIVAWKAWQAQCQVNAARSWRTITGRVIRSEVRETTLRVKRSISINQYRSARRYIPEVVYEYKVEGVYYRASRINFGPVWFDSDRSGAQKITARYPTGSFVQVAFDPSLPEQAVLNPGSSSGLRFLWLVSIILAALLVSTTIILLVTP